MGVSMGVTVGVMVGVPLKHAVFLKTPLQDINKQHKNIKANKKGFLQNLSSFYCYRQTLRYTQM